MKKILKKLFIVALAIGVLAPYIEIPNVKASTCSRHLQNYLFLDSNALYTGIDEDGSSTTTNDKKTLFEFYARSNGYQTVTEFAYEFPNEDVTIKNIYLNNFNSNNDQARNESIQDYVTYHNMVLNWAEANDRLNNDYRTANPSEIYGAVFVTNPYEDGYSSNSLLLHGQWTNYSADLQPIANKWQQISTASDDLTPFKNYVLQNTPALSGMNVTMYKGISQDDGSLTPTNSELTVTLLNNIVNSESKTELGYWQSQDKYSLPVSIRRKLSNENVVNDAIFGYSDGDTLFVFGTDTSDNSGSGVTIGSLTELEENSSYAKYKEYIHDNATETDDYVVQVTSPGTGFTSNNFTKNPSNYGVDFNIYESYQWPVVMSVEYETCSTPNPEGGTWELHYDGNYKDPKNIPAPETNLRYDEEVKLAAGPKRDGYTFKKWCTDKEGKAKCYDAETKITNPTGESKVTLFAQWGATNGADNKDTGVFSYIISFIAVGAIAGTIYYVSKKKNLFKQI